MCAWVTERMRDSNSEREGEGDSESEGERDNEREIVSIFSGKHSSRRIE